MKYSINLGVLIPLPGFSQPGMMNMNMGSGGMGGMAPFQTGMPPMGNSQKASPLFASEPHKQSQSQTPFKPNDSHPSAPGHNTQSQDNSAGKRLSHTEQLDGGAWGGMSRGPVTS